MENFLVTSPWFGVMLVSLQQCLSCQKRIWILQLRDELKEHSSSSWLKIHSSFTLGFWPWLGVICLHFSLCCLWEAGSGTQPPPKSTLGQLLPSPPALTSLFLSYPHPASPPPLHHLAVLSSSHLCVHLVTDCLLTELKWTSNACLNVNKTCSLKCFSDSKNSGTGIISLLIHFWPLNNRQICGNRLKVGRSPVTEHRGFLWIWLQAELSWESQICTLFSEAEP